MQFQTHKALSDNGITHGFFTRKGGVSKGIYDSLNAGYRSDDNADAVRENRSRIAASLGTSEPRLLTCHQCHSNDAVIISSPWGAGWPPKADAIVTNTPGIACGALAADCAPVLLADPEARVIGAAHAGWRGALSGITDSAIAAMESLGAKRSAITAIVGPCISQASYEVGPDFKNSFCQVASANARFFIPGQKDRQQFDLKAYVMARLEMAGVAHAQALGDCTYAQPQDYFSYRYNCHQGVDGYGRNISAIMLS